MISVEEALEKIEAACGHLSMTEIPVHQALNRILGQAVYSPINMPPFRQSAMDGYALNLQEGKTTYELAGEIAAGSSEQPELKPGQAVRIFTGAAVPDSANAIAQQEIVTAYNREITLKTSVNPGQNIRPRAEQIHEGDLALAAGTLLTPAAIGYLAGLGIEKISVVPLPEIGLLTTGNELVKAGTALMHGQIYESNSAMLSAAAQNYGYTISQTIRTSDDFSAIQAALENLISENDVVLISGGISVGDYDYVKEALEKNGVEEVFYKISQKPGKPIYVGRKGSKILFALPGNPASALTCFYIYVLPALQKLSGKKFEGLKQATRKITTAYNKKAGLAHFLKSRCDDESVVVLESQSSAMLNSFAAANALVFIPAESEKTEPGDSVKVFIF